MNPEIKKLWVDALRSGKYKQGTESLKNGDYYCCLGVLCDLYILKAQNSDAWRNDEYFNEANFLPWEVFIWAGMKSNSPHFIDDCKEIHLTRLNDKVTSFSEIADLIEKHL